MDEGILSSGNTVPLPVSPFASCSLFGEQESAHGWQCLLKDQVHSVFESVIHHDAAFVSKHNHSSEVASLTLLQEGILPHNELGLVLSLSLLEHHLLILILALVNHALDKIDILFAHLQFNFVLKHPNHSLNYHLLNHTRILLLVAGQVRDYALFNLLAELAKLVIAADHLLDTALIQLL